MRIVAVMPAAATLLAFAATTQLILLVPGPSVAYVVARSLEHGRVGGLVSMLGIESGALLHVVAAALGLTALIASSPWTFTVLKYGGAAYLVLLGIRQLRRRRIDVGTEEDAGAVSRLRLFWDGVLVDLLNPKTGLFFLAFLPQFVDPAAGSVAGQILVLGLVFVLLAALTDGTYAVLAGFLRDRLSRSTKVRRRINRTTGGLYLGLGGLAVLA